MALTFRKVTSVAIRGERGSYNGVDRGNVAGTECSNPG